MIVDFAPTAYDDLEAIGTFIARDNPLRAESFIDELVDRCLGLAGFPERFPLLDRRFTAVRRCVHGNYLILYRVEPDLVRILHIVHGAADYLSLFDLG